MRKWDEYLDDARKFGASEFCGRYNNTPFLVLVSVDAHTDSLQPDRFKTAYSKTASLSAAVRGSAVATKSNGKDTSDEGEPIAVGLAVQVQKRPGNAYPNRISIGRTKTNDIVLGWPLVSKFHAYITRSADRAMFLITDAGATNGTSVSGSLLVAGIENPLPDRAILNLGPYRFTFLLPETFHAFLLKPWFDLP